MNAAEPKLNTLGTVLEAAKELSEVLSALAAQPQLLPLLAKHYGVASDASPARLVATAAHRGDRR